jgi:hypothetical protein
MAKNLRQKISPSDTLLVQDVNPSATKRFAAEFGNDYDVQVVDTVKEVAEKSVSLPHARRTSSTNPNFQ